MCEYRTQQEKGEKQQGIYGKEAPLIFNDFSMEHERNPRFSVFLRNSI